MADKPLNQYDDIPVLDALDWLYIYDRESGKSYKVQAGALAALSGPVASVNSKTGAVTLSTDDISDAGKVNKYVTQAEKDKVAKITTTGDGTKVLADNGQYIIVATGGGGGTGMLAPVADLTALKNFDTTSEADFPDKWVIYVESLKVFYAIDRESTAAADDDLVVAPVAGPGRFIRNTLPLVTTTKPGLMSAADKIKSDRNVNGEIVAFAATNTYDKNKVMIHSLAASVTLTEAASGNIDNNFSVYIITGDGASTVSFGTGWKNDNGGKFDTTSGKVNKIIMHYINSTHKHFTITQPV